MIAGLECLPAARISRFWTTGTSRQRHLDPEVAAGDHDPAGRRGDDLLGVLRRLRLLDLGDQRDVGAERAQPLGRRLEVGGGGDEGDREQVDAVLDREVDPAEVVGAVGVAEDCDLAPGAGGRGADPRPRWRATRRRRGRS